MQFQTIACLPDTLSFYGHWTGHMLPSQGLRGLDSQWEGGIGWTSRILSQRRGVSFPSAVQKDKLAKISLNSGSTMRGKGKLKEHYVFLTPRKPMESWYFSFSILLAVNTRLRPDFWNPGSYIILKKMAIREHTWLGDCITKPEWAILTSNASPNLQDLK